MEGIAELIGIDPEAFLYLVPIIVAITNGMKKWLGLQGWLCFIPPVVISGLIAVKQAPDWWSIIMLTIILSLLSSGSWETVKLAAKKINGGIS